MAEGDGSELGLGCNSLFEAEDEEYMNDHATLIAHRVAYSCFSDIGSDTARCNKSLFNIDQPQTRSVSAMTSERNDVVAALEQVVYFSLFNPSHTLVQSVPSTDHANSWTQDGRFLKGGVAVGSGYSCGMPHVPQGKSIGGTGVFITRPREGSPMYFRVPSANVILPPHVVQMLGLNKRWEYATGQVHM